MDLVDYGHRPGDQMMGNDETEWKELTQGRGDVRGDRITDL